MVKTAWIRRLSLLAFSLLAIEVASATPVPSQGSMKGVDFSNALGLPEIKVEMAESRLKLSPSPQALNDVIIALEELLNSKCMTKLPQTLTYPGNPSDPVCIARMQRILELNPGNPVGLCVRDGITAQSCVDAYQNQQVSVFYPSSSIEGLDPALKVGLSAADTARITGFETSLAEINQRYQSAVADADKKKCLDDATLVYEQALSVACRVTSVKLTPKNSTEPSKEDLEITQTRERLLQVPPAIRGDYQRELTQKVMKELESTTVSTERRAVLQMLLQVIDAPDAPVPQQATETIRTRIVLANCNEFMELAKKATPDLPNPICYREGWYSPQCIQALKRWRVMKQQEEVKARTKAAPATSPAPSTFRF